MNDGFTSCQTKSGNDGFASRCQTKSRNDGFIVPNFHSRPFLTPWNTAFFLLIQYVFQKQLWLWVWRRLKSGVQRMTKRVRAPTYFTFFLFCFFIISLIGM